MSYKIHNGQRYDYAHSSIQCWADKEGCEIYEVKLPGAELERVLAPDEKMALEAYREANKCEFCGNIQCHCSE